MGADILEIRKVFILNCAKLEYEVKVLNEICEQNNSENLNSFFLLAAKRIVMTCYSIDLLCEYRDIVSASALCRVIADSYASLHLIYKESYGDEQILRYYLFLLDAINTTSKGLHIKPDKGDIQDSVYATIVLNAKESLINISKRKQDIIRQIKDLPIFVSSPAFEKIIENSNWKYKKINSINSYSWFDLYKMSFPNDNIPLIISEHLSTSIHGLANSNFLSLKYDPYGKVQFVYELLLCYISLMNELVHLRFRNDIRNYKIDFSISSRYHEIKEQFNLR